MKVTDRDTASHTQVILVQLQTASINSPPGHGVGPPGPVADLVHWRTCTQVRGTAGAVRQAHVCELVYIAEQVCILGKVRA